METPEELYQSFWEETGAVAPTQEIHPPLVGKWGEEERWRVWRKWILRRNMGTGKPHDHAAASRKGGLKGGKARAASLSAEERRGIATKAATARWQRAFFCHISTS